MGAAQKPAARASHAREESPPSTLSSTPPPISVTRQRRAIEPWKVLELKKDEPPARPIVRTHEKVVPRTSYAGALLSVFFGALGIAVTVAVILRFTHRPLGWALAPRIHALLEGRALLVASAASLGALSLALTFGIVAAYGRPRSFGYLVSAVGMLLVSVAFAFVAFTSGVHDSVGMTRDAVLLVVRALPLVPLGVALRVLRRGWSASADREGLARESILFSAALATSLVFVGLELALGAR